MHLEIVIRCALFCVAYAGWDERIDIHTIVTGHPGSELHTQTQAYVDWDFYIGLYTTGNNTDVFRVPRQWDRWNVSQYTEAVKESLKAQLGNMTDMGRRLFRYYFGNETGLIQMTHTCIGDPGDAYRVLTFAVNGSEFFVISLDSRHLWKRKTNKNLTKDIVDDCVKLLSDMTLNDTCPRWLFNVSRGYRNTGLGT